MEVLELEGTSYTPKVVFDLKNKVFEISGDSRPEDTHTFYQVLIDWLSKLDSPSVQEDLKFKFAFDYLNSSSSKFIFKLISCLKNLESKDINFSIDWFYDEPDIDMKELGEEYAELADIKINLISVEV
ncbi:MAG: DUF1987 domain-containing protein [Crocinitomicaceae bacterium]|nr:DUF1987 domain-containing protein [Crocinitomicaceae bacterium]